MIRACTAADAAAIAEIYNHYVRETVVTFEETPAASHHGRGVGGALYRALLDDLRTRNVHSVVGGIALPNAASVALHEKLGFRKVAHFAEVGRKLDRWVDVGYWQLIL